MENIKEEVIKSFKVEFGYYPFVGEIKIDIDKGIADAGKYWCKLTKTGKVKKHSWRFITY